MSEPKWTIEKIYDTVKSVSRDGKMPKLKDLSAACRNAIYANNLDVGKVASRLELEITNPKARTKRVPAAILADIESEIKQKATEKISRQKQRRQHTLDACKGCETIRMREVYPTHIYCAMPCPEGKGVLFEARES